MNKQPYTLPPRWWGPELSPFIVRLTRGYRRWQLRSRQRIQQVRVHGADNLRGALAAGQGVLITPNHAAHYDSTALYLAADQLNTPLYYMTAWQVFGMSSIWERTLMQRMGCFSIDRESADRKAFKQAVEILRLEPHPLVVFPEGDIYHITDRVTPFREGAAAIALAASRRSTRPVVIVPCGIKFLYLDDPTTELETLMTLLDERLFLRPQRTHSLAQRIYRYAEALLALKEIEFMGTTQAGPLASRIKRLAHSILSEMEARHRLSTATRATPDRVKELRQKIIQGLDPYKKKRKRWNEPEFLSLSRDMDDLFLVMQLYSYPGDYLTENPSIERLAETLDKFEEDVLDRPIPSVKGRRRVEVSFGVPISVPAEADRRRAVTELTRQMHAAVQSQIDGLCDGLCDGLREAPVAATAREAAATMLS